MVRAVRILGGGRSAVGPHVAPAVLGLALCLHGTMALADAGAGAMDLSWPRPYVQASSSAWSNGLPVLDIDGPWTRGYQARSGTQRAYQDLAAEAGVALKVPGLPQAGVWRVGVLARSQALVELSGQAAEVVQAYQSRQDPAQPRVFDAHTRALSWRGRGVALHSPQMQWQGWTASASAQWMSLRYLRYAQSAGQVVYQGGGSYDYLLAVEDDSPSASTPFLARGAKRGQAQSVSVALGREVWPGLDLSFKVDDLWSRLRWPRLNALQATVNTQVATKTAEGYINYEPAVRGQFTPAVVDIRIPRAYQAMATWQRPEGQWSVRVHRQWGLQQTWLGWHTASADGFGVAVEPRFGAVQLGAQWRGLAAHAMFDRQDSSAHVRQWDLSYQWPW